MKISQMLRLRFLFSVLVLGFPLTCRGAEQRPPQPNVVFLLADDLGWQDVKCYDIDEPSPMETPHIDALAKKGVMFWQAYSPAPTCAPSRCAIMSGNHPARAQKTHVVGGGPPTPYRKESFRMMPPWYSGRMPENELTLARVLQSNGYVTGHCGKWHMAISHHAFPQPEDQGFDFTRSNLGTTSRMRPDRLTGFATTADDDPFRLDADGYPFDQNTEDALAFLRQSQDQPFFLYFATWLVHTPIHTRNLKLLEKYCEKLGVDFPTDPNVWELEGQRNPYYCAMVEEFDHHVGRVIDHLRKTDDPRWPGHQLIDNTYFILTSDNGGMERHPGEVITDNSPLDRGKISAREGGTRVPLIVTGPGIEPNVQSDVMVNGLDFYPTILSLGGVDAPAGKNLDGCDLKQLLTSNPRNPSLVRHADGSVRDTMVWHFPHSVALESTLRIGDYKLIRKYDHINNPSVKSELELFHLYDDDQRVDIEESKNLADQMPEIASQMNGRLTEVLTEMNASYPYYNPDYPKPLPNEELVCSVTGHAQHGNTVEVTFQEHGARVRRANLIYTLNGGDKYEEWFRIEATLLSDSKLSTELPEGTTHYFINLIDEHQFLRSYPEVADIVTVQRTKEPYSKAAIQNKIAVKRVVEERTVREKAFSRWDTDRNDQLSFEEYSTGQQNKEDLERRFKYFDTNDDGKLTHDEFK